MEPPPITEAVSFVSVTAVEYALDVVRPYCTFSVMLFLLLTEEYVPLAFAEM